MQLPTPDPEALRFTEKTVAAAKAAIGAHGGWLPFDQYADLCLYDPRVGYYGAWIRGIGECGDFITAPELGSYFSEVVANKLGAVLRDNGGEFLELGAGTGKFAAHMVGTCSRQVFGLKAYSILETSGPLRKMQAEALGAFARGGTVRWLDALPDSFGGIVFGNELLDAIPCSIYRRLHGDWLERGVRVREGKLAWEDRRPGGEIPARLASIDAQDGYLAEVNMRAEALVRSLAGALERGIIVFVDYGFARAEHYHPQRSAGTLMCHWRHLALPDPLALPGISDITSHVDFTGVAQAAAAGGCRLLGFCDMGDFLANFDAGRLMRQMDADRGGTMRLAQEAKKLLMPHEMGQLYKVIVLGKGDCRAPAMGVRSREL